MNELITSSIEEIANHNLFEPNDSWEKYLEDLKKQGAIQSWEITDDGVYITPTKTIPYIKLECVITSSEGLGFYNK